MSNAIPVKVVVRVRPFNRREEAEKARECVQCFLEQSQILMNGRMFTFDSVFDQNTSQEMIYDVCVAPLIERLFKGFNCTVLAYGQTGSGKTYTMGTEESPNAVQQEDCGIISRVVDAIFQYIDSSSIYEVMASMLEIYEEKVIDLLSNNRECLQIRQLKGTIFVQGLSMHRVTCLEDTMKLLRKGCQLRSKGQTAMNDKSSRSHAFFTLTIERKESEASPPFKSKLNLIDLAGSERIKKTQAEGERLKEGIKINEGLLALGNVISTLSEQKSTGRHIPYRDAKITRLLQDSIGGNSHTVMIACISPADTNCEETMSTLLYADRAKNIKNKPVINIDPNVALIQNLKNELASAKHEILLLRCGGDQAALSNIQSSDVIGKCKNCIELEMKDQEMQGNYKDLNIRFAEAVAENSTLVEQLLSARQTIEQLKAYLSEIKTKTENKEYDDALSTMTAALALQEPTEEEKCKDGFEVDERDVGDETSAQAFVNNFAETQGARNKDMANILDNIKQKEKAYATVKASLDNMNRICENDQRELEDLKAKLDELENEKKELQDKLRGSSIHHKLSEERRKRLQELEKELAKSQKRLVEIKKMEKTNTELQDQCRKLNAEIAELKKARVQMLKQIKEEKLKFRMYKEMTDRSVMRDKNIARKREAEAARELNATNRQLAVYRRKYEEANACNRRLQMQLAKCTACARKGHFFTTLCEELTVAYAAAEAQVHCQILIDQRKVLCSQQEKLQKKLDKMLSEPPSKRRTGSDHSAIDNDDEKLALEEQIKNLEKEIELRGSELEDIQNKCTKASSDEQREQLWSKLRNIAEAKQGLEHLFEAAVSERRSCFEKELAVEEQKRVFDDQKKKYDEEINILQREKQEASNQVENLQKTLTETQLSSAQQGFELINIWQKVIEGHIDLPDDVIKKLTLVKEAANNYKTLQKVFKERLYEAEKARSRVYHGRLRQRTAVPSDNGPRRSLSESVLEEMQNDNSNVGHPIRENPKPVERLGVAANIDAIFSDTSEENESVADGDITYQPTPRRATSRRRSSTRGMPGRRETNVYEEPPLRGTEGKVEEDEPVAGCSKEPNVDPNATFTVAKHPKVTKLQPVPETEPYEILDHRSIVTRDIFQRND